MERSPNTLNMFRSQMPPAALPGSPRKASTRTTGRYAFGAQCHIAAVITAHTQAERHSAQQKTLLRPIPLRSGIMPNTMTANATSSHLHVFKQATS